MLGGLRRSLASDERGVTIGVQFLMPVVERDRLSS
jgi:hypothetical protein